MSFTINKIPATESAKKNWPITAHYAWSIFTLGLRIKQTSGSDHFLFIREIIMSSAKHKAVFVKKDSL